MKPITGILPLLALAVLGVQPSVVRAEVVDNFKDGRGVPAKLSADASVQYAKCIDDAKKLHALPASYTAELQDRMLDDLFDAFAVCWRTAAQSAYDSLADQPPCNDPLKASECDSARSAFKSSINLEIVDYPFGKNESGKNYSWSYYHPAMGDERFNEKRKLETSPPNDFYSVKGCEIQPGTTKVQIMAKECPGAPKKAVAVCGATVSDKPGCQITFTGRVRVGDGKTSTFAYGKHVVQCQCGLDGAITDADACANDTSYLSADLYDAYFDPAAKAGSPVNLQDEGTRWVPVGGADNTTPTK